MRTVVKETVARTRFLDAAEAEFAATGYGGARTRSIAEAAGARIGTLHHYWQSKTELFREVCRRRFDPIATDGQSRLEEIQARLDSGATVAVTELLRAIIDSQFPAADDSVDRSTMLVAFHALYSRTATDPAPEARTVMEEIFDRPAQLFTRLLRRIRPDMDECQFYWVINCVFGTLIYTQFQGLYAAGSAAEQARHMVSAASELVELLARAIGPAASEC